MTHMGDNPFAILTFIAAPAILTNASSIMSLGTSNRFARAIDRARMLSAQVENHRGETTPTIELNIRQLQASERRALLLVRALTAFYFSVGAFAAASLISLLGAGFFVVGREFLRQVTLMVALGAGLCGVGGLVTGSCLLVFETRMTLRILGEETDFMLQHARRRRTTPPGGG
jgi:hypothetical protein